MAFIPVPNTVRISLVFSHEGQTIVNTVHASKSGGPSAGDLAALASSMQGWWVTYLAPYSSQNFCLQQVNVVDLSAADAPSYWLAVSPAECGTVAEEGWTANVAAVISFRSDFRGRNARGRMFVAGLKRSYLDSAVEMTGACQTNLLIAAVNIAGALATSGFVQTIASRYFENAPRLAGVTYEVVSAVVDAFLDSQRRRLAGRGT